MFSIRLAVLSFFLQVSFFSVSSFAYDAVDIAAEQITIDYPQNQYVWYGNGPDAFDCTGLTKYAYGHVGIDLPRGSKEQGKVGDLVVNDVTEESNLQKLQRGDLLFFDTADDGIPNDINHAAIYEGNGAFIHASWIDVDIVRYNFNDQNHGEWWRSHFLFARRLPSPPGPSIKFMKGEIAGVTEADVNVKGDPLGREFTPMGDDANPDLVTSVGKQTPPAQGSIGSRPIYSGYPYTSPVWRWYVDFESGPDGWVAEDYLTENGFTPWLSGEEYQAEFDRQSSDGHYPVKVEGRNFNGESQYRGKFVPFPSLPFYFYSIHGHTQVSYKSINSDLLLRGYTQIFLQTFVDRYGITRYQSTWTAS